MIQSQHASPPSQRPSSGDLKSALKRKSRKKRSNPSSKHLGLDLLVMAIEKQDEPSIRQWDPAQPTPLLPSISSLGLDRLLSPPFPSSTTSYHTHNAESLPERLCCYQCGATDTPKWRRGSAADGYNSVRLCNACGIRSKRSWIRKVPTSSKLFCLQKSVLKASVYHPTDLPFPTMSSHSPVCKK